MRFIGRWTPAENNRNTVTCHATGHAHSILPYSLVPVYCACAHVLPFSATVFSRRHVSRVSLAQPTSPCRVRLSLRGHRPLSLLGCLMVHCALTHASSVVVTPRASATRPRPIAHSRRSANTIAAVARNVPARSAHAVASSSARTLRPLHLPPAAILCVSTLSPATHLLLAAAGARAWGWVLALLCRVLRFVRE